MNRNNNDNPCFLDLKENKDAEWIVKYLQKWETILKPYSKSKHHLKEYEQDRDNIERLTIVAWKHYCKKH